MAQLYSNLKFLKFADNLTAIEERRVVAPVHVRIKPTNTCNHNCWYCAYRTDDLKLGEDMNEMDSIPRKKIFEIVDDLIEMKVKAVTFSGGGEPLLYKPLPDVVKALAAGGIKIGTLTNGTNLKGRMAEAFAEYGTWVRISVDAWDDNSYVEFRGAKPNSFSKLLDNMRAFVATDTKCVLGVSLIVGKSNYRQIADICRQFKDVGVNHVKISGVVVGNDVIENTAYHAEIKDEVAKQIDVASSLPDDHFDILNHYHDLDTRFDKPYSNCPFLQFLTIIGADQTVYTCQDKAYTDDGKLGSIVDRRFKDFWFSPENKKKLYEFDPSVLCAHHCVSHTKNLAITDILSLDPNHGVFV